MACQVSCQFAPRFDPNPPLGLAPGPSAHRIETHRIETHRIEIQGNGGRTGPREMHP